MTILSNFNNTSLAAPGALAHRLQHRTPCNVAEANLHSPPGKYSHDYRVFRIIRSLFADYQEHSLIIEHTVLLQKN